MIARIKSAWATFQHALTLNRWPVQTEQEAIEEARKRVMELLYPKSKENS